MIFSRFMAKLGPETPLNRRGSSYSAGCTKNQPRRPILRQFRDGATGMGRALAMWIANSSLASGLACELCGAVSKVHVGCIQDASEM